MATQTEPGKEALIYEPSAVSWAVADAVARPPAVLSRVGLYLIALITTAAVAYAYKASVAVTIDGPGIFKTSGKVRPVRTQTTGKVAQLNVSNGKHVKKDEVLVEMEDALDPREQERAKAIVTKVRDLLGRGDSRATMTEVGVVAQEPLRMRGAVLVRERTSLAEALNGYYEALRTLHDTTPELARADVSERQVAEAKIEKIHSQHLEADLRNELTDLEKSVSRLAVSIRDRQEQARRGVASAKTTLEVQIRTFEEALHSQTENLQVTAPVGGVISALAVTGPGELVQAGQLLFQIIPEGGHLVAEVKIANKDIADLRVGLPVQLKLDAYPFQDYGTLPATLTEIAADVTEGEKGGAPYYLVQISPKRSDLESRGKSYPVKLGMTVQADIEVRRRTLLQLAVIEVLKLKDSL